MIKKIYGCFLLVTLPLIGERMTDPFRLELRHIESKGIGYNQGYTTFEAFYAATEALSKLWVPFLDFRAHAFNDWRFAVNAGVGLRYVRKRVWGVHGYYDYRNTSSTHYNQFSAGIESLGRVWDFRLSGYLPFGHREFALKSLYGEAGIHVNSYPKSPLYFAAGPYYLNGSGRVAWGGALRGSVDMYRHIRLEVSGSYDPIFKWIAQGQLGVFFLIGGKKEGKPYPRAVLDNVRHVEIIPILH